MSPTKTGATWEAYYMTCFSVLFSSLTLPFPGAYLGHSVGVSYAPQNGVLISFGGIWSSERQPGPLSVSVAVTRSLTVTLHNFTQSLIHHSVTDLLLTSLRDSSVTPHMLSLLTLLRHRANVFSLQGTSCQYHKYLLPGTQPSGTTGEESAARVQLPSYLNSVLLAISKKPLHFFFLVYG